MAVIFVEVVLVVDGVFVGSGFVYLLPLILLLLFPLFLLMVLLLPLMLMLGSH